MNVQIQTKKLQGEELVLIYKPTIGYDKPRNLLAEIFKSKFMQLLSPSDVQRLNNGSLNFSVDAKKLYRDCLTVNL